MTHDELQQRLAKETTVSLERAEWEALRGHFEVVAEHDTRLRGALWVLRGRSGLTVVEEPSADRRVARAMASEQAVDAFVAARLATYERMWDGCGCKIDYDA